MSLAPLHAVHNVGRLKRGYLLLTNPRVNLSSKLLAFGLGFLFTLILVALEVPLEGVLAFLLPFAGAIGDVTFDGIEMLLLPLLFACLLLPSLAPPLKNDIAPANSQLPTVNS